MHDKGILIGGEQSGHIILPGEPMGDGMLTALVVTKVVVESGKTLAELARVVERMPQVLINAKVSDEVKQRFRNGEMDEMIERYNKELLERGWRLLVRASGTEPLIRVTIWGDDEMEIRKVADEIARSIKC